MTKPNDSSQTCPCGSQRTYSQCCGTLHSGKALAASAEALMRSRYSAFVQKNSDYLIRTHCDSNVSLNSEESILKKQQEIESSFNHQQWLSLRIIHANAGRNVDITSTVEFVAFFTQPSAHRQDMIIEQLHELSYFKKINQAWFYTHGKILPPIKIGRNEPCPCGTGKKFKQCHA